MNTEKALELVREAIAAAERLSSTTVATQYPGLPSVLDSLRAMRQDLEAGAVGRTHSGIGRHVVDQWPFSELGEKVLAAVNAYERHLKP